MAVYQFSALFDGQAISFNPAADILNFDQATIAAADLRVTFEGANARVSVVSGAQASKDVLLQNVSPVQLASSNVTFADGSRLLFGDNSAAQNDNAAGVLTGTAGRDLIAGFGGNDTMVGGDGADVFVMSSGTDASYGADSISGGLGFDVLDFTGVARSAVAVNLSAGTLSGGGTDGAGSATLSAIDGAIGGDFNDTLTGSGAANRLEGGAGNDVINASSGDDTLRGGTGVDTLNGGSGNDQFIFAEAPGPANADQVIGFVTAADKLVLDRAAFGALGAGDFTAGDARFRSGSGLTSGQDADDRVIYNTSSGQLFYDADGSGAGAAQLAATLQGAPALSATDISVTGAAGSNSIQGTAGNDSLTGTEGNDSIDGLGGNDTLDGGGGEDTGDDTLSGGSGDDRLTGYNGADFLRGGDGDDTLNGATGGFDTPEEVELTEAGGQPLPGDTLEGGLGNDVFHVQRNDVIADEGGIDSVFTDQSSYTLPAGFENLTYRPFSFSDGEGKGISYTGNSLDNTIRIDSLWINSGASFDGGDGNDLLIGGLSMDRAFGGAGNDTIIGGSSDLGRGDSLSGGDGDDRLVSSGPNDSLIGGTGADSFVFETTYGGGEVRAIADFVSGTDKVVLDGKFHDRIGSSGNFTADDARFYAAPGATAAHDATDRVIYDTSTGELFYDPDGTGIKVPLLLAVLQPGAALVATDIAVENGSADPQTISGTAGNDSLVGNSADGTIDGLAGNDTIEGLGGNDTLIGGDGADVFVMSSGIATSYGFDVIDGRTGFDVIDFTGAARSAVTVNLSAGTLSGGGGTDGAGSATLSGIDGAIGGAFNDSLTGSDAANRLEGGAGNDTISASSGNDTVGGGTGSDLMFGGSGNDSLTGNEGADVMRGGDGDDTLDGASGTDLWFTGEVERGFAGDTLDGGLGNDLYFVQSNDIVSDAGGIDTIRTDQLEYTLPAGIENLRFTSFESFFDGEGVRFRYSGNELDNLIVSAGAGSEYGSSDTLDGGAGNDTLVGGNGDTVFRFSLGMADYGHDQLDGNGGFANTIDLSAARSPIFADLQAGTLTGGGAGGAGSATLVNINSVAGGAFDDHIIGSPMGQRDFGFGIFGGLFGGGGNDTIEGVAGASNLLFGGDGDDRLIARGDDDFEGGPGADSFVFARTPGTSGPFSAGVSDFASGSDKIVLDAGFHSGIGASGNFAADDERFYAAAGATSGHDTTDRVIYDTSTGNLYYDADGSGPGGAQLIAAFQFAPTIVATDITVERTSADLLLVGGAANDTLIGAAGSDTLNGADGNDSLSGAGGSDSLLGGGGDDTLDGGASADTLEGGAGNDTYFVTAGDSLSDSSGVDLVIAHESWTLGTGLENLTLSTDRLLGLFGEGNELDNVLRLEATTSGDLFGRVGNDTLFGGDGPNLLLGEQGNDVIHGGGGADRIAGNAGNDVLFGDDGNDVFDAFFGGGDDTIDGGAGSDMLDYDSAGSAVVVDMGTGVAAGGVFGGGGSAHFTGIETVRGSRMADRITGDSAANTLLGSDGSDTLDGGAGNDSLNGEAGDDTLEGGAGNDTLQGAGGNDSFVFRVPQSGTDRIADFVSSSVLPGFKDTLVFDNTGFTELGGTGKFAAEDPRFFAGAGATSGQDASDRLIFNTSTGDLYYDADGSGAAPSVLVANVAGPVVAADITVIGQARSIQGTAGNDSLTGTEGADSISGIAGSDVIDGLGGDDTLDGGLGNDTLSGGGGQNQVFGGEGNDSLLGSGGTFNFLDGGPGIDTMVGGLGMDRFEVTAGDVISDPGGLDTVDVVNISWTLGPGFEVLGLSGSLAGLAGHGNELDNTIVGFAPDMLLDGHAGHDTLVGAAGSDTLIGGAGNDLLTSGAGSDRLIFAEAPGSANADFVKDFQPGVDRLVLDGAAHASSGASGVFAAGDGRFFAAAGATGGHDADDRLIYDTHTGAVYWDADGSGAGAAQRIATLQGAPALAATDIQVVGAGGTSVHGTAGNDVLAGTNGNDTLDGGAGVDTMSGGLGDDTYIVTAGDVLSDAGGIDTVVTDVTWTLGAGFENVTIAGTGNVKVIGNNGSNFAVGNAGNNTINMRAGNDTIQAGAGNDWIEMSAFGTSSYGDDVIDGGAGVDAINFANASPPQSAITVDLAAGTIRGGGQGGLGSARVSGVERVITGDFDDRLGGDRLANTLDARGGNDTLSGGGGNDTLIGGAGADSFLFVEGPAAGGVDRVNDFVSGTDELLFENGAFTALGAAGSLGAGDARFAAGAGFTSGRDASDRLVYDTTTGRLYYDADGSGAGTAQHIATFAGNPVLTATDITVI